MYKSHKQISKIQKLSNCLLDTIPIHANSVCFWFDKSCDVIPSTYNVGGDNNKDYYIVLVTDNKKLNRTYDSNGFYYLYYKDNYIRCHYKSYYSNDPSELIGKYILDWNCNLYAKDVIQNSNSEYIHINYYSICDE
jgi:hypothetical protein